jgi:hypothetical protein
MRIIKSTGTGPTEQVAMAAGIPATIEEMLLCVARFIYKVPWLKMGNRQHKAPGCVLCNLGLERAA